VYTILLVEDDAMNRDMLVRRLVWEHYQVITAANGAEAVALATSERPDLVLMDMGLPVLTGWQAAQQLKEARETRAIPIIALTAYAMAEDRIKALTAGCDDYEVKPPDFPRLLTKIRTLLDPADTR
jgi:CheY-like chemotaxis protein